MEGFQGLVRSVEESSGEVKAKSKHPFTGRWRIVSINAWDVSYIDEEEEGYFEFADKAGGEFHFGYVHGQTGCRLTTRDG